MNRFRQEKRWALVLGDRRNKGSLTTAPGVLRFLLRGLTLLVFGVIAAPGAYAQSVDWAKSAGGTYNDWASAVATDGSGSSYVTGMFSGTATFGLYTLTGSGGGAAFVAKYDDAGNVQWAVSPNYPSNDLYGCESATDASGNSYVTGAFLGTATFGDDTLTSAGSYDVFVAKCSDS